MKNRINIMEILFAWAIFFGLFSLSIVFISEDWAKSPITFLGMAICALIFTFLCSFMGSLEDKNTKK